MKPNLMCIVEEKTSKAIQKDGITKWVQNQAPKLGPTQNLNQTQWQWKNKSEMMLGKECSCMFSWGWFTLFFDNYSNGGM